MVNRGEAGIEPILAQVRTECEQWLAQAITLNRWGDAMHLYHCALVYAIRDGLAPEEAAEQAWLKNVVGQDDLQSV